MQNRLKQKDCELERATQAHADALKAQQKALASGEKELAISKYIPTPPPTPPPPFLLIPFHSLFGLHFQVNMENDHLSVLVELKGDEFLAVQPEII